MTDLSPLIAKVEALSGPDRAIVERLDRTGDCWLWTGKLDDKGRGRVWRDGKLKLHHRAVWEILVGPIPAGALLCHHCDNPQCANPAHIYVGDGRSNVADMFNRKRHWTQRDPDRAKAVAKRTGSSNSWARGASNPKAKLSPAQVEHVRTSPVGSVELAKILGVNPTTIQRIRKGTMWRTATLRALQATRTGGDADG